MRLLLITTNFPSPVHPTRAVFNGCMMKALAREHQVRVIAPISWVDELRSSQRSMLQAAGRRSSYEGIEVVHPRYDYPPKVLRGHYG